MEVKAELIRILNKKQTNKQKSPKQVGHLSENFLCTVSTDPWKMVFHYMKEISS